MIRDEKKNSGKPFEKSGGEKHRLRGGNRYLIFKLAFFGSFMAFFYCTVKVQLVILILSMHLPPKTLKK